MSKRLHIFLMTSILIFSFCFIEKVYAYKVWNNITFDEEKITELTRRAFNDNTIDLSNYYVTCSFYVIDYYGNNKRLNVVLSNVPLKYNKSNSTGGYYTNWYDKQSITRVTRNFKYNINNDSFFDVDPYFQTDTANNAISINGNLSNKGDFYSNYDIVLNGNTQSANLSFSIPMYTYNFYLNGGILENNQIEFITGEDFSLSLYQNEFEDFINNSTLEKKDMIFENWYYDEELTQPFSIYDTINSDTNLYAKYRYKTAEDFISKNPFNEYDFDQNYLYALINRGDKNDSVFIGLPFRSFDMEIYEYNEQTEKVKEGASACPVPIFIKDGYYYYDINTLYTNDQEILILPKSYFDNLSSENYHFYLSNNAYINYTNDLSEATIVNSSGEEIQANFQNSYETSRQYQETYKNKENSFAYIKAWLSTLNKTTSIFTDIFQYTFNSFNETIQGFLTYIALVIVLISIIVMIRRF